jgi:uncharacterized protein (DUF362 family)
MPNSRVALIRGDDRYQNVCQALVHVAADVDLAARQHVLIKPNFVATHKPQAITHVDAVRAVLDFVRARYDGPVTIAEGPALQPAAEAFRRYGYDALAREYGVRLLDLNHDDPVPVDVYDWRLRPLRLHLARTVVESDFRISLALPKTHDVVVVTLSLKNIIMGSLISRFSHGSAPGSGRGHGLPHKILAGFGHVGKIAWRLVPAWMRHLPPAEWVEFRAMSRLEPSDKMKMHQSYPVINLNLACLAPRVLPHLAVLDGFVAMEGNGPTEGTPVPMHLALVSTDALALDVAGTVLMGFDPAEVGYLCYCREMGLGAGRQEQIEIVGNATLADCSRRFRPHATYRRQRRWRLRRATQYLPSPSEVIQ